MLLKKKIKTVETRSMPLYNQEELSGACKLSASFYVTATPPHLRHRLLESMHSRANIQLRWNGNPTFASGAIRWYHPSSPRSTLPSFIAADSLRSLSRVQVYIPPFPSPCVLLFLSFFFNPFCVTFVALFSTGVSLLFIYHVRLFGGLYLSIFGGGPLYLFE